MNKLNLCLVSIVTSLLLGCSLSGLDQLGNGGAGTSPTGSIDGDPRLVGTWAAPCRTGSGSYEKSVLEITPSAISKRETFYSDSGCTQPVMELTVTASKKLNEVSSSSGTQYELDARANSAKFTSRNPSLVPAFQASSFCGISAWALNVPQEVIGKNCGGTIYFYPGQPVYLWLLTSIDEQSLWLSEDDGDSYNPNARPDLDLVYTYTKQ